MQAQFISQDEGSHCDGSSRTPKTDRSTREKTYICVSKAGRLTAHKSAYNLGVNLFKLFRTWTTTMAKNAANSLLHWKSTCVFSETSQELCLRRA